MPVLFSYLLKLSVSLAVVFLFYQFVLRRLTFYNWNRLYLLLYTGLSFLIPFIDISRTLQQNQWSDIKFVEWVPVINTSSFVVTHENNTVTVNYWLIVSLLIAAGMAFMLFRLISQLLSFQKMKKKAELISVNAMKVYQVNETIIPFSFGNSIFINCHLHSESELGEIIRHEFVHARQRHSLDIIWAEILCLLNWYNPFVWLIKKSIRQNLEFIADNKVLENGVSKKQYQYLLLKVIGNNQYSISNQFNFSSLKKRIAMMNKMKSARMHIVKFLFILPLVAVLLLAFRNKNFQTIPIKTQSVEASKAKPLEYSSVRIVYLDTTTPKAKTNGKEIDLGHVSDNYEITDKKATIHLKNGETEEYDLTNKDQRKKFEEKYGKIISVNSNISANVNTNVSTNIYSSVAPVITTDPATIINVSPIVTTTVAPVQIKANLYSTVSSPAVVHSSGTTVIAPMAAIEPVKIFDDYGYTITGKEDVLVTITKNTSQQELEQFIKQMKEKGIQLNFDNTIYNNKGILTHISGIMKSDDGSSKFSATDFKELILATIKDGDRTYFKVSVKDNRKVVI